jgi:hypothetical protein
MKPEKMRRIVEDVLAARAALPDRPVTFDTLVIDFDKRTVRFRGRTITVDHAAVSFPMLNTDHMVWVHAENTADVI